MNAAFVIEMFLVWDVNIYCCVQKMLIFVANINSAIAHLKYDSYSLINVE